MYSNQKPSAKKVAIACLIGGVALSSLGYMASNMSETSVDEMTELRGTSRTSSRKSSSNTKTSSKKKNQTKMEQVDEKYDKCIAYS